MKTENIKRVSIKVKNTATPEEQAAVLKYLRDNGYEWIRNIYPAANAARDSYANYYVMIGEKVFDVRGKI